MRVNAALPATPGGPAVGYVSIGVALTGATGLFDGAVGGCWTSGSVGVDGASGAAGGVATPGPK